MRWRNDSRELSNCFLKIAQVYLRLAGCRVYKGRLQNEWVIKNFPESSERKQTVYTLFYKFQDISKFLL